MVLSTLIPSAMHLALALGAVLVAWAGNPLRAWAATRLASENEADWLGPQLYLTLGWLVPVVVAPLALLGAIIFAVGLVQPLSQGLAGAALHAIFTARAWGASRNPAWLQPPLP
jgi:hypothetical protein